MVNRKTYYVPTIDHNQFYVENADNVFHFPPGASLMSRHHLGRGASGNSTPASPRLGRSLTIGRSMIFAAALQLAWPNSAGA
jgi:hypothetical protein